MEQGYQQIETFDTYEAGFYLSRGARIIDAKVIYENKKVLCSFVISAEKITALQAEYFSGNASVNLWEFRRCFTRLHSLVGSVKAEEKKKQLKLKIPGVRYDSHHHRTKKRRSRQINRHA